MPAKNTFQGAEAIVTLQRNNVIKERVEKKYRHPQLDARIRIQRTRKELRLLEKASRVIRVPRVLDSSGHQIILEKIEGKNIASVLDTAKNKAAISRMIGLQLAKLHDAGIIHGDLTTSNMMYTDGKVYFIDFGLGYESQSNEDKAVDLHVLKEALGAKHPKSADRCFGIMLKAYKTSRNGPEVLKRLEIVEKRGRYKQQY